MSHSSVRGSLPIYDQLCSDGVFSKALMRQLVARYGSDLQVMAVLPQMVRCDASPAVDRSVLRKCVSLSSRAYKMQFACELVMDRDVSKASQQLAQQDGWRRLLGSFVAWRFKEVVTGVSKDVDQARDLLAGTSLMPRLDALQVGLSDMQEVFESGYFKDVAHCYW